MTGNEMSSTTLMNKIRELSFTVLEATLFLDTHPDNTEALEYYNDQCDALENVINAYEAAYGPLTIYGGSDGDNWDWIRGPWPWEAAANRTDTTERTSRRQV